MNDLALKTLESRELRLNTISLRGFYGKKLRKGSGGGSGDGFPQLPGDVTRWHFGGLTNEMMAAMDDPRIEDADHKGRFLSFKNFAWAGMSGVGGYKYNFLSNDWSADVNQLSVVLSHKIVIINKRTSIQLVKLIRNELENTINITLKITGLEANGSSFKIYDNVGSSHAQEYNKDGIYQINYTATEGANMIYFYVPGGNMGQLENPITIEQLPLYPGALVFDGVDDYGTCNNFPILTKEKGFTIVAVRQFISDKISSLLSKWTVEDENGAFIFEGTSAAGTKFSSAFGGNFHGLEKTILSYMTSTSYNGNTIVPGDKKDINNNLVVGRFYSDLNAHYVNAAIWEIVILDHDATEEELAKIKDYFVKTYPWLFPDQAWTVTGKTNEDEDRATIANITGNGNDLVLSNLGFAEGSGYGLYAQNYISYAITNRAVYTKTNSSIHVTKSITAGVNFTESARDVTIPSYRIKVTGIQSGQEMIYRGSNNTFLTNIPSDGIYVLPAVENGSNLGFQFVSYTGDCNITIEQIPEYEGYLVTDGVDDRVVSSSFTLNKDWTIVGNWKMLQPEANKLSGIVKQNSLFIYNHVDGLNISINDAWNFFKLKDIRSVNAICSDGRIYLNDWTEIIDSKQQTVNESVGTLVIGILGNVYTSLAFKNLGFYNNQNLSKDDCIKAYNYLQTLKAK